MSDLVLIGSFNHPRLLQGLVDYGATLGVQLVIQQTHTDYGIYAGPDDESVAKALFEDFIKDPSASKYQSASWQVENPNNPFVYANQGGAKEFLAGTSWFYKAIPSVAIALFLLALFGVSSLYDALRFQAANPITWLTPALLHFSWLHLIFNLVWWLHLGKVIELKQGTGRLGLVFLVSALGGHLMQYLLVGPYFGGLSGVVYGLLGYVWLSEKRGHFAKGTLGNPVAVFMFAWLVLGFFEVLPLNIANWAHLGGLIAGLLMAFAPHKKAAE